MQNCLLQKSLQILSYTVLHETYIFRFNFKKYNSDSEIPFHKQNTLESPSNERPLIRARHRSVHYFSRCIFYVLILKNTTRRKIVEVILHTSVD